MADQTKMKLGRRAIRHDPRTLQLARYMKALPRRRMPSIGRKASLPLG